MKSPFTAYTYLTLILSSLFLTLNLSAQVQLVSTKSSFSGGNNIGCYGAADGSISVAVIGADSLTLVLYKDNAQLDSGFVNTLPHQWTSLGAGDYVVKGYVSDSMVGGDSLRMYQPGSLGHAPPYIMNESCTPSHDGILSIEGMGGTLPYTYTWAGSSLPPSGGNGGLLDSLVAGTYYLNIIDANGCSLTDTFTLGTATPPSITVHTNPLNEYGYHFNCHSEGSVWATPTGGTGNLTVSWVAKQVNRSIQKSTFGSLDTVETRNTYYLNYTDTITNQHSGTFIATVTDALGCTASDSLELKAPVDLHKEAALQFNPDYTEGSGLWAIKGKFTVAGGIPPYTIWGVENGPDTVTFYVGNTYPIKSTDAVSCYNWGDDSLNFTYQAYLQICQEFGGNCGGGNTDWLTITGVMKNDVTQFGGNNGHANVYIGSNCQSKSASLFLTSNAGIAIATHGVMSGSVQFDSLAAGNYIVIAYGCDSAVSDTTTFSINQLNTPPPPQSPRIAWAQTSVYPSAFYISTANGSDGWIRVYLTDTTYAANLRWYKDMPAMGFAQFLPSSTTLAENLSAGNYLIRLLDNFGNKIDSVSIMLTQPMGTPTFMQPGITWTQTSQYPGGYNVSSANANDGWLKVYLSDTTQLNNLRYFKVTPNGL